MDGQGAAADSAEAGAGAGAGSTAAPAPHRSPLRRVVRLGGRVMGGVAGARPSGQLARRAVRSATARRGGALLAVLVVSLAGAWLGIMLGAHTENDVGPFRAELSLTPSLAGDTEVNIPPLGSLHLDSHDGPAHLKVQLGALDQGRTEALFDDLSGLSETSRTAVEDVTQGVLRLALRALGVAVLSALLLGAVVFRNMRRTAWAGGIALLVTGGSLGVAANTIQPNSIEQPRYEGLLVNAPAVVGDARLTVDHYDRYAQQLQGLVTNVTRIYTTVSTLPVFAPAEQTIRVLHVSDLHLNPTAWSVMQTVVDQFEIDLVIDTGDINDWGTEPEASFVGSIARLKVPYVYVRGNHDSQLTQQAVSRQPNAVVLDNTIAKVGGLTIAGIGDPRFTPDDRIAPANEAAPVSDEELLDITGRQLAETVRKSPEPVDLALVHDPKAADGLAGECPLVLSGHAHRREIHSLAASTPGEPATRLMVQGSTGGAGLRGLRGVNGEDPLPLAMSVLYFDQDHAMKAYDDIRVGGTGQAQVTLERKVVSENDQLPPNPTGSAAPTPSGPLADRATPSGP